MNTSVLVTALLLVFIESVLVLVLRSLQRAFADVDRVREMLQSLFTEIDVCPLRTV